MAERSTALNRLPATNRQPATNRVAVRDMGTALRFDGVDDYVEIPNASLPASTFQNGFTLSARIKPRSAGEVSGRIFDKSAGTTGQSGFFLGGYNKLTEFKIDNGLAVLSAAGSLSYSNYTHVVVTVSSDGLCNVFIKGLLSGSANQNSGKTPSVITTTNALRVGNRSGGTDRSFDGIIDEPRIWNRALSAAEISNLYFNNIVPRDGYVEGFPFDEASGNTTTGEKGTVATISGATFTTDTPLKLRSNI